MDVDPSTYQLRPGDRTMPVVWMVGPMPLRRVPDVTDEALEVVFGAGASRKLKSWGHDALGVHWLVTRSGTPLHVDLPYLRYTHHLLLRNDGWRLRGVDDSTLHPVMLQGHLYCLDTHSPHQVLKDERIEDSEGAVYKVQLAVDRAEPLTPEEAFRLLAPRLRDDPVRSAGSVQTVAPRWTPK